MANCTSALFFLNESNTAGDPALIWCNSSAERELCEGLKGCRFSKCSSRATNCSLNIINTSLISTRGNKEINLARPAVLELYRDGCGAVNHMYWCYWEAEEMLNYSSSWSSVFSWNHSQFCRDACKVMWECARWYWNSGSKTVVEFVILWLAKVWC